MEAVVTSQLAFLLSVGLIQFALPLFGEMVGTSLSAHWLSNPIELAMAFGFTVFVGVFSGLYPAFFVSSFDPQRVLKGVWKPGKGGAQFRTALVGMQVAISLFLVMGTFIVYQQLHFLKNKDLGFDKEEIIMLTVRGTSIPKLYYPFKHKLESHSSIVKVSSVSEPVGREVQFMSFKVEGQAEDQVVKILNVGYDFVETMGLQLKEGRDFSRQVMTDSTAGFMINEAAARQYGWTQPLGKGIKHALWNGAPEGTVIGVLKDFNFEPLHSKVDPLIIFKGLPAWYLAVRLQPGQVKESLAYIESVWKEFEPAKPFNFHFLDQSIQQVYEKEERIQRVFFLFAALSIATVALGLFGLVSFVAEQRLAEIGVRKILGASAANIIALFAKDYARMMALAFLLAVPVTYYVLTRWLQNFAFHITLKASFFLTGGIIVFLVVLGTVLSRAWMASTANPVDVLKSE
jgi:putative ABC transport system permease protein